MHIPPVSAFLLLISFCLLICLMFIHVVPIVFKKIGEISGAVFDKVMKECYGTKTLLRKLFHAG